MDLDALADRLVIPSFSALGYRARSRRFDPLPRLDGRTVVLTGPTSGIGAAAAKGFDELGASLVLVGRSPEKLDRLAAGLTGRHRTIVADLSRLEDARSLVHRLDPTSIDAVVHNAGAMFERSGSATGTGAAACCRHNGARPVRRQLAAYHDRCTGRRSMLLRRWAA